jgi:hypothetical protein
MTRSAGMVELKTLKHYILAPRPGEATRRS